MVLVETITRAWMGSDARRRYQTLASRERRLVCICIGLLAVLATYAVVDGLIEFRAEAVTRYQNEQRDLEWMKVNQHRVSAGDASGGSGELLSTVVNSTAARFGFRPRRTQTETDGISARIEAEEFENVLRWAHALESRHGVVVARADVDLNEPGRVDARFSLR